MFEIFIYVNMKLCIIQYIFIFIVLKPILIKIAYQTADYQISLQVEAMEPCKW